MILSVAASSPSLPTLSAAAANATFSSSPRSPLSALSSSRLNLHNHILTLIHENDLDEASLLVRQSIYSNCRPTIFTRNAFLAALLRQSCYTDLLSLHRFITQASVASTIITHNLCFSSSSVTASIALAISIMAAANLLPLFLIAGSRCPLPPATPRDLVRSLSLPVADILSLSDLHSEDYPFEDCHALADSHDLLSSPASSKFATNSTTPHRHRIPFPPPSVLP